MRGEGERERGICELWVLAAARKEGALLKQRPNEARPPCRAGGLNGLHTQSAVLLFRRTHRQGGESRCRSAHPDHLLRPAVRNYLNLCKETWLRRYALLQITPVVPYLLAHSLGKNFRKILWYELLVTGWCVWGGWECWTEGNQSLTVVFWCHSLEKDYSNTLLRIQCRPDVMGVLDD